MPEGPEVRRMAQDLATHVSERTLTSFEVLSGRYTKKSIQGITELKQELPMKVIGVGSHGKFMYMLTNSGFNIWNTLGMTGSWSSTEKKHSRVRFNFLDGTCVYFNDIRNFGTLKCVYGKDKLLTRLRQLGPDLLSEDIDEEFFVQRLRDKNCFNITKILMDQKTFSGIGNYVKSESLWLAEINPLKDIEQINDEKLKILCRTVKSVLRTSYNSGGATFMTHKNFSDKPGSYSDRFLCYNRKIDAEGNKVIKTKTPDGRTTHWAPNKQEK